MQLGEILDNAIADCRADFGTVQAYDSRTGTLTIARQRGHTAEFLDHFRVVNADDGSACGRALLAQRVTVADIRTDPAFAPHRQAARSSGFLSVHSASILNDARAVVGAISVHFRDPNPAAVDCDRIVTHVRAAAPILSAWPQAAPPTDSSVLESGPELSAAERVRAEFAQAMGAGAVGSFGLVPELNEQLSRAVVTYVHQRRAHGATPEALLVELKSLLFLHPRYRNAERHELADRAITLAIRSYYQS